MVVDVESRPHNLPVYRVRFKLLCLIARLFGIGVVANSVMPITFSQDFLNDPARVDLREKWRQYLVNNDKVGATRGVAGLISREAPEPVSAAMNDFPCSRG
jgi:hypothetical protein